MLIRTTNGNEMTKKKGGGGGSHLKTLLFSDIYKIQIVQNTTQLSSRGDLINHPYFYIIKILEAIRVDKH
jgi:hypothetical protein